MKVTKQRENDFYENSNVNWIKASEELKTFEIKLELGSQQLEKAWEIKWKMEISVYKIILKREYSKNSNLNWTKTLLNSSKSNLNSQILKIQFPIKSVCQKPKEEKNLKTSFPLSA